jgi:hypothetical protein
VHIDAQKEPGTLNTRIITVGSVTYAHKARRLLQHMGINSRVVKIDSSRSKNGCTHGIEFSSVDFYNVVMELKKAGFEYSQEHNKFW